MLKSNSNDNVIVLNYLVWAFSGDRREVTDTLTGSQVREMYEKAHLQLEINNADIIQIESAVIAMGCYKKIIADHMKIAEEGLSPKTASILKPHFEKLRAFGGEIPGLKEYQEAMIHPVDVPDAYRQLLIQSIEKFPHIRNKMRDVIKLLKKQLPEKEIENRPSVKAAYEALSVINKIEDSQISPKNMTTRINKTIEALHEHGKTHQTIVFAQLNITYTLLNSCTAKYLFYSQNLDNGAHFEIFPTIKTLMEKSTLLKSTIPEKSSEVRSEDELKKTEEILNDTKTITEKLDDQLKEIIDRHQKINPQEEQPEGEVK